jgi:hypothetical protein
MGTVDIGTHLALELPVKIMYLEESFEKVLVGVKAPLSFSSATFIACAGSSYLATPPVSALSVSAISTNDNDDNDLASPAWCLLRYP